MESSQRALDKYFTKPTTIQQPCGTAKQTSARKQINEQMISMLIDNNIQHVRNVTPPIYLE